MVFEERDMPTLFFEIGRFRCGVLQKGKVTSFPLCRFYTLANGISEMLYGLLLSIVVLYSTRAESPTGNPEYCNAIGG